MRSDKLRNAMRLVESALAQTLFAQRNRNNNKTVILQKHSVIFQTGNNKRRQWLGGCRAVLKLKGLDQGRYGGVMIRSCCRKRVRHETVAHFFVVRQTSCTSGTDKKS